MTHGMSLSDAKDRGRTSIKIVQTLFFKVIFTLSVFGPYSDFEIDVKVKKGNKCCRLKVKMR